MVRCLRPADHQPARMRKAEGLFEDELDFQDIKLPIKIRDIHKIEKKSSISISVLGYENKQKYTIYEEKML